MGPLEGTLPPSQDAGDSGKLKVLGVGIPEPYKCKNLGKEGGGPPLYDSIATLSLVYVGYMLKDYCFCVFTSRKFGEIWGNVPM